MTNKNVLEKACELRKDLGYGRLGFYFILAIDLQYDFWQIDLSVFLFHTF